MKFTKADLAPSRNMLKALGKGEWKLDGMEILAFADMMKWFGTLQRTLEQELAAEEAAEKAKAAEQQKLNEGVLEPKAVEDPIKLMDPIKKVKTKKDH